MTDITAKKSGEGEGRRFFEPGAPILILALLLIACSAAVRAVRLTDSPLNLDEAISIMFSGLNGEAAPPSGADPVSLETLEPLIRTPAIGDLGAESFRAVIRAVLKYDLHPPLFYLLLQIWRAFFGDSETAIRLFAAFFTVLSVGAVYLLARLFFTRSAALLAVGIFTTLPAVMINTLYTRMYPLVLLFAAGAAWGAFGVAGAKEKKGELVLSSLVLTLCAFLGELTQYFFAFWLLPLALFAFVFAEPGRRRVVLLCFAAAALLCLPWFWQVYSFQGRFSLDSLRQFENLQKLPWGEYLHRIIQTPALPFMSDVCFGYELSRSFWLIIVNDLLIAAVFAFTFRGGLRRNALLFLAFFLLPLALGQLFDLSTGRSTVEWAHGRPYLYVNIALAFLLAAGVTSSSRIAQFVSLLLVAANAALALSTLGTKAFRDVPAIAERIKAASAETALVVYDNASYGNITRIAYYLRGAPPSLQVQTIGVPGLMAAVKEGYARAKVEQRRIFVLISNAKYPPVSSRIDRELHDFFAAENAPSRELFRCPKKLCCLLWSAYEAGDGILGRLEAVGKGSGKSTHEPAGAAYVTAPAGF